MILQCERCQTRFRLEASRLPPTGARVRCSRCKHSFFAMPPGDVTRRGLAHALAAEAAASGGVLVPGVTRDLDPSLARPIESTASSTSEVDPDADLPALSVPPRARATAAVGANDANPAVDERVAGDDNEWEFEQPEPAEAVSNTRAEPVAVKSSGGVLSEPLSEWLDLPLEKKSPERAESLAGFRTSANPPAEVAATEIAAPSSQAEPAALDSLGSPESWDFFASEEAAPIAPVPAAASKPPRTVAAAPTSVAGEAATQSAPEVETIDRMALAPRGLARWAGVFAALCAIGGLSVAVPAPRAASSLAPVETGSGRLEDLRGRFVEHAIAGSIFVVTGTLHGTSAGARVPGQRFVLRVGDGVPASFGASPTEASLREAPLASLRAELDRSARRLAASPLTAGDRIAVTAILADVPQELRSFVVETAVVSESSVLDATAATSPASLLPSSE